MNCHRVLASVLLAFSALGSGAWAQDRLAKEPDHLYICTFNIYLFGAIEPKYSDYEGAEEIPADTDAVPARIVNLANVLAVGGFDLVVIEELDDGEAGAWALADLVTQLRDAHGLDYASFTSETIGEGFRIDESIGYLYDAGVVEPVLPSGSTSLSVSIPVVDGRALSRTQWVAGDLDFTLIAGHLEWGDETGRDNGYELIEEILTTPTPSAFSADPDIVVLGDFNRFGMSLESVKHLEYEPGDFLAPNVVGFDPGVHTRKQVGVSHIAGLGIPGDNPQLLSTTVAKNTSVYDMILLTNDLGEEFPPGEETPVYGEDFGIIHFDEPDGFGFQDGTDALSHNPLKEAYSDHRPLWIRLRTDAGESDSGPAGLEEVALTYVGTEHGAKFHEPGCSTIRGRTLTESWTTRNEALDDRGPCGVCKP